MLACLFIYRLLVLCRCMYGRVWSCVDGGVVGVVVVVGIGRCLVERKLVGSEMYLTEKG